MYLRAHIFTLCVWLCRNFCYILLRYCCCASNFANLCCAKSWNKKYKKNSKFFATKVKRICCSERQTLSLSPLLLSLCCCFRYILTVFGKVVGLWTYLPLMFAVMKRKKLWLYKLKVNFLSNAGKFWTQSYLRLSKTYKIPSKSCFLSSCIQILFFVLKSNFKLSNQLSPTRTL